jgi:endonuclease V-like protein UPF0215 family
MRIVGVDDGGFHVDRKVKQHALLVAVLFLNLQVASVNVGRIEVDGRDANSAMASLLSRMKYDAAMLAGISFGGFNVVDIAQLSRTIRKPVIVITGERPHNAAVQRALRKHFPDWRERWRVVRSAGRLYSHRVRREPPLYFEVQGATSQFARKAISSTATISRLPEPIRVARILARGLSQMTSLP